MNSEKLGVLAVVRKGNEVLLVRRRDIPVWVLPGGGRDPGETPEMAVIREVAEETGFKVHVVRHAVAYTTTNKLGGPVWLFVCAITGGSATTGAESKAVSFFPIDNLPSSFFILHRDFLQDALIPTTEVLHKSIKRLTYWAGFEYLCCHPIQAFCFLLSKLK